MRPPIGDADAPAARVRPGEPPEGRPDDQATQFNGGAPEEVQLRDEGLDVCGATEDELYAGWLRALERDTLGSEREHEQHGERAPLASWTGE
jgi:hypothetical protein